jgi:hypothetical protein
MFNIMHLKKKKLLKLYNEPNPKLKLTKQCVVMLKEEECLEISIINIKMGCILCGMGFVGNFDVNGIICVVY